jgi:hypothetical protein
MAKHPVTVCGKPLVSFVVGKTLAAFLIEWLEILHQMASDVNKLKRQSYRNVAVVVRKH